MKEKLELADEKPEASSDNIQLQRLQLANNPESSEEFCALKEQSSEIELMLYFKQAVDEKLAYFCYRFLDLRLALSLPDNLFRAGALVVIREDAITILSSPVLERIIRSDEDALELLPDLIRHKKFNDIKWIVDDSSISFSAKEYVVNEVIKTPEGAGGALDFEFIAKLPYIRRSNLLEHLAEAEGDESGLRALTYLFDVVSPYGVRHSHDFKRETLMACLARIIKRPQTREIGGQIYKVKEGALLLFEEFAFRLLHVGIDLEDILNLVLDAHKARAFLYVDSEFWEQVNTRNVSTFTITKCVLAAIDAESVSREMLLFASKNDADEGKIIQHWLRSPGRKTLFDYVGIGILHISPKELEECLVSACRDFSGDDSGDMISDYLHGKSFVETCRLLGQNRVENILIEEHQAEALLRLAVSQYDFSFDFRAESFARAFESLQLNNHPEEDLKHHLIDRYPAVQMPPAFYEGYCAAVRDAQEQGAGEQLETLKSISRLLRASEGLGDSSLPCLTRLASEFGHDCSVPYFQYCIRNVDIFSNNARDISTLNQNISSLRHERVLVLSRFLKDDITSEYLAAEPLRADLLADITRLKDSEWGEPTDDLLQKLVATLDKHRSSGGEGSLNPLPKEFVSGVLHISLKEKDRTVEFSRDFLRKYSLFAQDLHAAAVVMESNLDIHERMCRPLGQLRKLVNITHALLAEVTASVRAGLRERESMYRESESRGVNDGKSHSNHMKAVDNLRSGLARLESLSHMSSIKESVGDIITAVAEFGSEEQQRRARRLLMEMAIYKGYSAWFPSYFEAYTVDLDPPTRQTIAALENAINHVTYKETWLPFVRDNKAYTKALRKLLPSRFLEEQLVRYQDSASGKKGEIRVYPARGLALEVSGHMGDACWASRYESINEQFPNILTLVFTKKSKVGDEVVGSSLLIESKNSTGERLLIIRGLNPLQKIMGGSAGVDGKIDEGSLLPESFVQELKAYLEPIARARGARLAIVIDNHSGGSGTNRPVLHSYLLNTLRPTLNKVQLESAKDTTFNDYDIRQCTYYL